MAEQTFKSPGFFEKEIEYIERPTFRSTETPVGIIGPAEKGPAFVPTTVQSLDDYIRIFGNPDLDRDTGHAAAEFFSNNGRALTMCRVLGGGSDAAGSNAGFEIHGRAGSGNGGELPNTKYSGAVQFLVASHTVSNEEHLTVGMLNDNDSITIQLDEDPSDGNLSNHNRDDVNAELVRAMIFMEKDHIMYVTELAGDVANADDNDVATVDNTTGKFKLIIAHRDDADAKVAEYLVSLDPSDDSYISKVLNTDSFKLDEKLHYLYLDFPVDKVVASTNNKNVAILRGNNTNVNKYGDFKSRFKTPKTTSFISQPFGEKEYDLFHFETLDDGAYGSDSYKISISDLTASTDPNNKYGTFSVSLRALYDTDADPIVFGPAFERVSLDPSADNFIARVIGDQKVRLNLDVDDNDEKRLVREGTYENNSTRFRVVVSEDVLRGEVPEEALPFGFRGIPTLKTTTTLKDGQASGDAAANSNLTGADDSNVITKGGDDLKGTLGHSIVPPLPYRMKTTTGDIRNSSEQYFQNYLGQSKVNGVKNNRESVNQSLHWGLNTSRISKIHDPNYTTKTLGNNLIKNLTKFLGASSDMITSGNESDTINNNKFSLSKVALSNLNISEVTGSISDVFLEAVYIRNAEVGSSIYDAVTQTIDMGQTVDPFNFEDAAAEAEQTLDAISIGEQYIVSTSGTDLITVGASSNDVNTVFIATSILAGADEAKGKVRPYRTKRATLAKLLSEDKSKFNKYNVMSKFTAPFYGGFDGVNIMDRDSFYFTDRSSSADAGGKAGSTGYSSGLFKTNDSTGIMSGTEENNNSVASYKNAIRVMTDEMVVDHNVLVVPGIRDSLVTDFAARRVRDYGKAIYLMDIPHLDSDNTRIFVSSSGILSGTPDPDATSVLFDGREVNNNYVATYFPDVTIIDQGDDQAASEVNPRLVHVPSSVVALGALAKTDTSRGSAQWFAPAGFSRGALTSVRSTDSRLSAADRDILYESRINPIASFPNKQFVIFGQKTTQLSRTSLDRVNVRRLMINIKRRIQKIAQNLMFSQNDERTRASFVSSASSELNQIKAGSGIEDFRVIMDSTNNTQDDVDNNRLNGRIIVVPTRAVEFIAMDFIIGNSGVEFPS